MNTRSTYKKTSYDLINLQSIDNINHQDDINSKSLSKAFSDNGVKYLKTLNSSEQSNACFFKYLDLESALLCLKNKNIRFAEPTRWEDKYEGRFYQANYDNVCKQDKCTPLLYACCMTHKQNNEAAWKIYTYGKTGLGAHCVQFKINRHKFRMQLARAEQIKQGYTIFEGRVLYCKENVINDIHKQSVKTSRGLAITNKNYHTFFDSFDLFKYLNLLLLKRDHFKHENEIRFFIIPNDINKIKAKQIQKGGVKVFGDTLDINIDWADIIEGIKIDDKCTDLEYEIFKDACLSLLPTLDLKKNPSTKERKEYEALLKKFTPIRVNLYGKRSSITIE